MGRAKKKEKAKPQDGGFNPKQKQQLRSAIRQVWSWSYARKVCVARATRKDGFGVCEKCKSVVAKLFADHIEPCGDVLSPGYLERTFRSSKHLQALCKKCHDKKTREEAKARKAADISVDDF
jgi:hypothetical protein